jgi:hypothetical protein
MSDRASPRRTGGAEKAAWYAARGSRHAERALEGRRPPVLGRSAPERAAAGVADGQTGPFGTATWRAG